MTQYYKPHRNPKWNYGGPKWRLSRSKIDLFMNCPKCFYLDNKLGVARPAGYPFSLNSAVDALLKKEFDAHRENKTTHPLMEKYGIKAVPFDNPKMNTWREVFEGIEITHESTGFTISGAVDDIWADSNGKLFVVDYKSTSKDERIDVLDQDWQIGYKRQMEIYQWLLRKNGFDVSDTGYFVYANARRKEDSLDSKLEFEMTIVPYVGSSDWVEQTLQKIKETLDSNVTPKASEDCDYCSYRKATRDVLTEKQNRDLKNGKKSERQQSLL